MILYFSAEGNSAYAAKKIAAAMHDHAVSMEKCDPVLSLQEDEKLGIVTPTYFWQLPSFVRAFLERLQLAGSHQSPYGMYFWWQAMAQHRALPAKMPEGCSLPAAFI